LTDHYMRCAIDSDENEKFYPFCTALSGPDVRPWTEILVRAFGNDQDLFGFIMLGAYQDSRPESPGGKPSVKLGLKDLFVFLVYMAMAMPIPQLIHYMTGPFGWPKWWGSAPAPSNIWGWQYMEMNSYASDHRWYLMMILKARIFLGIAKNLHIPAWAQCLIATVPCCLPSSIFETEGGVTYMFDICEYGSVSTYVQYWFSWLFRNFGDGCAMYYRWVQWYGTFYVWCFHYLRLVVMKLGKVLPKGRTWAAASLALSMYIGVLMAMFHYPNNVLETGSGVQWAPLEVGIDILQPSLFALGMTYLPLNLSWWGNTTLGCYVFHFYFRDSVAQLTTKLGVALTWDSSGLIFLFCILAMSLSFTSVVGPLGHYVLLSPTLLGQRVQKMRAAHRSLQQQQQQQPRPQQ